jgi:hypothetical protein
MPGAAATTGGDRVAGGHRRHDVAQRHEVGDRFGLKIRRWKKADGSPHGRPAVDLDAHQLVGVNPHRVVDDAVRFEREQRVDVVRCSDTQRRHPTQLANVAADFVG